MPRCTLLGGHVCVPQVAVLAGEGGKGDRSLGRIPQFSRGEVYRILTSHVAREGRGGCVSRGGGTSSRWSIDCWRLQLMWRALRTIRNRLVDLALPCPPLGADDLGGGYYDRGRDGSRSFAGGNVPKKKVKRGLRFARC